MELKIGCDIVSITRFEQSVKNGGKKFLNRIFSPSELLRAKRIETLAGMFAAKEAVIKALELKTGSWHKIEIEKSQNGHPEVKLADMDKEIMSKDISISHDGDFAMAATAFLINS